VYDLSNGSFSSDIVLPLT